MMHSKAKRATKAEKERMAKLKGMPCVACLWWILLQDSPTEVHHLLSGNKRRGHHYTVPLCVYHHRGIPAATKDEEKTIGPSLARSSKAFHAAFGTDDELLARTNAMLERIP